MLTQQKHLSDHESMFLTTYCIGALKIKYLGWLRRSYSTLKQPKQGMCRRK